MTNPTTDHQLAPANSSTSTDSTLSPLLPEESEARQRVRIVYQKGEAIKFISHQDETRMWERTLRRADLPLLYKQGFNPQPHIQIAAPLGLGFTGLREPIDITFSPPVPLAELQARIAAALPPGAAISALEEVPLKAPALQSLLIGADYTILIYTEPDELSAASLQTALDAFLATPAIWRERERKGQKYRYNLRPLILELDYLGYDPTAEEHRIHLRVQQRPGATGRPDEVVDAVGLNRFARTLQRDRLYFSDQPDDAALFAAYPVILQEEISEAQPAAPRRRRKHRAKTTPQPKARSISERAADEFS